MRIKLGINFLFVFLLIMISAIPAFGAEPVSISEALENTVSYYDYHKNTLNNWEEVVGLSRAGENLSNDPWQLEVWDVDSLGESSDSGEYAGYIISMVAAGEDPANFRGKNLVQELKNRQTEAGDFGGWLTSTIWSIVALDEAGADYNAAKAMEFLLAKQTSDGGFALSGDTADPDVTGFALIALAPHTGITGVSEAVEQAKTCLKGLQTDNGGFGTTENSSSISSVIRGLVACGEDVTSSEWVKNNYTMIDALFEFQLTDFSFCWKQDNLTTNDLSTRQALVAIADLAAAGYGNYLIDENGNGGGGDNPSDEIDVTVRVEGLEETGTILEKTSLKVAGASKLFDALKKALDDAGISNKIDPTASWLNTGDITINTTMDLSNGFYWMYSVNDQLDTDTNPELNQGDRVTVYLSYYSVGLATAYAKLTLDKEEVQKGNTVTATVFKSDGGWLAGYIPAPGVTVYFGNDIYTTDANGQVTITAMTVGNFNVYAEKYQGDGIPEIVKTDKLQVVVKSGGSSGDSDEITVKVAVVGEDGDLLFGPDSVKLSKDDDYGQTALGALDATDLEWEFSEDDDGMVIEIEGQRNKGQNGWMYKVNSAVPNVLAGAKQVKSGDKIIWWYSNEAMSKGPDWNDLEDESGSTEITSATAGAGIKKSTIADYQEKLIGLKQNTLLNRDKKMTSATADKLKEELAENSVSLSINANQAEHFIADNEASLLIPEKSLDQTTNITVKELAASQQPKQFAVKLGSSVYEFGPGGTKFNQPVTITIMVPLTEDIDASKLSPAWYNEETKTWMVIPAVIDLETGLVVFQIDHFTKFAVIQYPDRKTFPDVGENMAWAKDAVEILAGKGFINGTGTGFEPKRSISRAEFVKIIVTALELETKQYKEGLFTDVKEDDWFADYIMTAYQEKIITGDQDGKFRPGDSISRNEVAAVLFRLQEAVPVGALNTSLTFKDTDKLPAWAINGIKYANQQGLMTGYEDGTFKGSNSLTRAEAAVTIYRYLGLSEQ